MTSAELSAAKFTGKLNSTQPVGISIETVEGKVLFSVALEGGEQEFASGDVKILPDIYVFKLGEHSQTLFLDGGDVAVNGFVDIENMDNTNLEMTGIDANDRFFVMYERYKSSRGDISVLETYGSSRKASPEMLSAMLYLTPPRNYEAYKAVMAYIPDYTTENTTLRLARAQMDKLYAYRIGGPAFDFEAINEKGEKVKLSDFRGKYVLLDFWASWCGPCRMEMTKLKEYYPKYEGKDVVFISLSLDDTQEAWKKGLEEEKIPWITLWDTAGGFRATNLTEKYGFRGIPFLVIIDKEGNVAAREVRGPGVEKALDSLVTQ